MLLSEASHDIIAYCALGYWTTQKTNFETENVGQEVYHSWRPKWCQMASNTLKVLQ